MVWNVVLVLIYLLAPAGVLWLCRRVPLLGKIGPILILYLAGIVIANTFRPAAMAQIQDLFSNVTIPLAIPLMLFGCTFSRTETRSQLLALITGLVAVALAVVAGFFIFGRNVEDGAKIGGMLTGVYTGGTMNMAALKSMLGVSDEHFILLNSYDIVISFLYLTFLMTFGIKLFRRFLPNETNSVPGTKAGASVPLSGPSENPYSGLLTRDGLKDAGILLGTTALIIGISAGIALILGNGRFMTVFFLLLTTLGIAASFVRKIHNRKYGYEMGMYLIYIFSIVVASMADFSKIDLMGGLNLLGYLTLAVFGSLALQVIMARIFRIDSDTMVISSVTYICSPPFVPMICACMGNRKVLAPGLAIGVLGYAIGNYLGYLIFHLLTLFL